MQEAAIELIYGNINIDVWRTYRGTDGDSVDMFNGQDTCNLASSRAPIEDNNQIGVEPNFDKLLDELARYKERHGHCNVPEKDLHLGIWCTKLRQSYRDFQKGTPTSKCPIHLTLERIKILQDMEFRWTAKKTFEERVEDLAAFKKSHGHCNVPTRGPHASLGFWCYKMKGAYRDLHAEKPKNGHKLDEYRIKLLRDVGFTFK